MTDASSVEARVRAKMGGSRAHCKLTAVLAAHPEGETFRRMVMDPDFELSAIQTVMREEQLVVSRATLSRHRAHECRVCQ